MCFCLLCNRVGWSATSNKIIRTKACDTLMCAIRKVLRNNWEKEERRSFLVVSGPASCSYSKCQKKKGGPGPGVSDLATRQEKDPVKHQQHNEKRKISKWATVKTWQSSISSSSVCVTGSLATQTHSPLPSNGPLRESCPGQTMKWWVNDNITKSHTRNTFILAVFP